MLFPEDQRKFLLYTLSYYVLYKQSEPETCVDFYNFNYDSRVKKFAEFLTYVAK